MVSSHLTLQLLLAVGAALAAPSYFDNEGVYSREISSLNFPEKRSVMLETQAYRREYEDAVTHIARDVSLLSIRGGSDSGSDDGQPSMSATHQEHLDWHTKQETKGKEAVKKAQELHDQRKNDPNATKAQKDHAKNNLHTAKEALAGHQDDIEYHKGMIAQGHK